MQLQASWETNGFTLGGGRWGSTLMISDRHVCFGRLFEIEK